MEGVEASEGPLYEHGGLGAGVDEGLDLFGGWFLGDQGFLRCELLHGWHSTWACSWSRLSR